MALATGTQLGPYEIVSPAGSGGMGEVYQARDTRLGRTVAIKVLPAHLSSNPELRSRLQREAKAISSLQHPHICTLFDIGHQDGIDFLVMEFLEGETLAERLRKGPLAIEQIVRIGIEIADALSRAHRQGIVHRDLKPGNVMLTKSGAKLMDFGIAKAAATARDSEHQPGSSAATTQTAPSSAITAAGRVVGTFQYLSPEQIQGRAADARSDIFAFGAMLYEMCTGRSAFAGQSELSVASAILEREPEPISSIQPLTPPALQDLVQSCLAKDPEDRIQTAHDLRLQLLSIQRHAVSRATPASNSRRTAVILLAAVVLVGVVLAVLFLSPSPPVDEGLIEATILPPPGSFLVSTSIFAGPVEISPDGTRLAFVAQQQEGAQILWVRSLGEAEAKPLAGTEGASRPFWSPDGRHLGFFADQKLKKIAADGGPVFTLGPAPEGRGGTWNTQGTILYAASANTGLVMVQSDGGGVSPATTLDAERGDTTHRYPWFLPNGKDFLVLVRGAVAGAGNAPGIFAGKLGEPGLRRVADAASNAIYASGFLVYVRESALVAQPFDLDSVTTTGPPRVVLNNVRMDERYSRGVFSASQNGVLVYQTGAGNTDLVLELRHRDGSLKSRLGEPAEYFNGGSPSISPDGKRVLSVIADAQTGAGDIWQTELQTGTRSRITAGPDDENSVCWSADGRRVAYVFSRHGRTWHLVTRPVAGTGTGEVLLSSDQLTTVDSWSPDLAHLLLSRAGGGMERPQLVSFATASKQHRALLQGDATSQNAQFSPDGRFVAFVSDEAGREEVYVTPFPPTGARWQVSQNGGLEPRWRRDGRELFFFAPDNRLMAAQVHIEGDEFRVADIHPLFRVARRSGWSGWRYDAAPDGQSFVVTTALANEAPSPISLLLNWPQKLR